MSDEELKKHTDVSIGKSPNRVVGVQVSGEWSWKRLPPNVIRIGNDLARINLEDGTVTLGEGVPVDDAAQEFWEAIYRVYNKQLDAFHFKAALAVDKRVGEYKEDLSRLEDRLHKIQTIAEGDTDE